MAGEKNLSSQYFNIKRTQFNQSSPVQPVSEIQKSQKITFLQKKFLDKKIVAKKKCYPLSFSKLRGRNLTRALQSSRFQKYKNLENLKRKRKEKKLQKKKMLSSQFSNIRRTRFDQSSPVQPASESRGGSTSVTDGQTKEILVSNFGFIKEKTLSSFPKCSHLLMQIEHSK